MVDRLICSTEDMFYALRGCRRGLCSLGSSDRNPNSHAKLHSASTPATHVDIQILIFLYLVPHIDQWEKGDGRTDGRTMPWRHTQVESCSTLQLEIAIPLLQDLSNIAVLPQCITANFRFSKLFRISATWSLPSQFLPRRYHVKRSLCTEIMDSVVQREYSPYDTNFRLPTVLLVEAVPFVIRRHI